MYCDWMGWGAFGITPLLSINGAQACRRIPQHDAAPKNCSSDSWCLVTCDTARVCLIRRRNVCSCVTMYSHVRSLVIMPGHVWPAGCPMSYPCPTVPQLYPTPVGGSPSLGRRHPRKEVRDHHRLQGADEQYHPVLQYPQHPQYCSFRCPSKQSTPSTPVLPLPLVPDCLCSTDNPQPHRRSATFPMGYMPVAHLCFRLTWAISTPQFLFRETGEPKSN